MKSKYSPCTVNNPCKAINSQVMVHVVRWSYVVRLCHGR